MSPADPHRFKDEWLCRAVLTLPGMQPAKVDEFRRRQKPHLCQALVESGLAKPQDILEAVRSAYGVPSADPAPDQVEKLALGLIPEKVCRAKELLPFRLRGESIDVLMLNPLDLDALADVQAISGRTPQPHCILPERMTLLLEGLFSGDAVVFDLLKRMDENESVEVLDKADGSETPDEGSERNGAAAPVIRLVNSVIVKAVRMGASDIHMEHEENSSHVRLRVDGALRNILTIPRYVATGPMVSRIKIMSNLDVAEHRRPQDGRAKLRVGPAEIGLRVSILPTSFGEKVVIRILDKRAAEVSLEKMGLRAEISSALTAILGSTQGILLVTGPTGSGKTTTLYSVLNRLKSVDTNIVTVEDPIEYRLDGVNQVQVNEKQGLTFASILRSVLRQDPDIILVGEVRDRETADTALQASLTGHFVLSTLHTNDAVGAVARLADMGAERFKIAGGLLGVLAQRLVRRLCPDCREAGDPASLEHAIAAALKRHGLEAKHWKAKGCQKCGFSGFKGRMPLVEFLSVDAALKEKIAAGASEAELRQASRASGALQTMTYDALWHLCSGDTTVEEILPYLEAAEAGAAEKPAAAVPAAKAPTASAASAGGRKRVLVTDDDAVIRMILRQILQKEGYEVAEAADGVQALGKLAEAAPDLLLVDLHMPNLDGWGVIRGARESLGLADLPIIVLTADSEDRSQEEALRLGADDYILKPLRPPIVLARIRALFRRNERRVAA